MEVAQNGEFVFRDPRQARIYRRLGLIGTGPAAFYKDVCRIVQNPHLLASSSHVVAHLYREIESAVRDVLMPNPPPAVPAGMGTHRHEIITILTLLGIDRSDSAARIWESWAEQKGGPGLATLAHRRALQEPRAFNASISNDFDTVFDLILDRFEAQFVRVFESIDAMLAGTESIASQVSHVRQSIPNNFVALDHLFKQVHDPGWLIPLLDAEFFANPPLPEYSADGREVRYHRWPQIEFLLRLAREGADPEVVTNVLRSIPVTRNMLVEATCVAVALELPTNLAASVVPRFVELIGTEGVTDLSDQLAERLGALVTHLARGGYAQAALQLTGALLDPLDREPVTITLYVDSNGNEVTSTLGDTRARLNAYSYQAIVRENVPDLIQAAGVEGLDLLCQLLDKSINAAAAPEGATPPVDLLDIWWPEVESRDEMQLSVAGIRGALVAAVRDAAKQLSETNPQQELPTTIEVLRSHPWNIYLRLEWHLIRQFAAAVPELVRETLADPALITQSPLPREYKLLLRDQFATMSETEQSSLLEAIVAGPPPPSTPDEGTGEARR